MVKPPMNEYNVDDQAVNFCERKKSLGWLMKIKSCFFISKNKVCSCVRLFGLKYTFATF